MPAVGTNMPGLTKTIHSSIPEISIRITKLTLMFDEL